MPAPSTRTGIPAAVVGLLLAVILVAGFALGPRAFDFRAWPEHSRDAAVAEVVARSAEQATEVPVVQVRGANRRRGDALAVRGRGTRSGGSRDGALNVRSRGDRDRPARGGRASGRGTGRGDDQRATPPPVVIVEEAPAEPPVTPVSPPEEPARFAAEVAPPQYVLRPESDERPSAPRPDAEPDRDDRRARDRLRLLDGVDELAGSLLPDERRRDHRGRPHRGR